MSLLNKELTEKNQYTLEIGVDKETFDAAINQAYKKNVKKINVPGFRKGKAPRVIIEKMYGKGFFYEDAVNECIPDAFEAALKESELDMVGHPDFDVKSIDENGLVLIAKITVKPEVAIADYLGIEAVRNDKEVTDADVDAEIDRMRERNARTVEITDRAAAKDDIAVIDFDGSVDGVRFDGGKAEDHELKLGSGQFIPGFEDQIVGKSVGDSFDVNVTFPEEYHEKSLAGKAAVFAVKLKALKVNELPAADDEFAKDVSEFDTFAAYREDVKAKAIERNQKQADSEFEENVMKALCEKLEAEIPECMFEAETENFLRDYDNRLRMQGLDLATYFKYTGMNLDILRKQMRPQAEEQVKLRLALEKIASLENITVSEDDIAAEYKRISEAYNMPEEEVRKLVDEKGISEDLRVKAAAELVKSRAVAVAAAPAKKVTKKATATTTAKKATTTKKTTTAKKADEADAAEKPATARKKTTATKKAEGDAAEKPATTTRKKATTTKKAAEDKE